MGAFGSYNYNPKTDIDFSKLNTVAVMVNLILSVNSIQYSSGSSILMLLRKL